MSIALAIITGSVIGYMAYKLLFDNLDEFVHCAKFWLTPDIISLFRGQFYEDMWAEMKLILWLVVTIGCGYGMYAKF